MPKFTDYAVLSSLAAGDEFMVVDVSDTSMAATGTNKKVSLADLIANLGTTLWPAGLNLSSTLNIAQPGINIPAIVLPGGAGGYGYGGGLMFSSSGSFNTVQYDGTGSGMYMQSYGASVNAEVRSFHASAILSGFMGANPGSTDIITKIGTRTADASVNTTAKLSSFRTGIGGTEVEKAYFLKDGSLTFVGPGTTLAASQYHQLNGAGGGVQFGYRASDGMCGLNNGAGSYFGWYPGTGASATSGGFTANSLTSVNGVFTSSNIACLFSTLGASSTDKCVAIGTSVADASVNASAKIASFGTGITGTYVEKSYMLKNGQLMIPGTAGLSLGGQTITHNGTSFSFTTRCISAEYWQGTSFYHASGSSASLESYTSISLVSDLADGASAVSAIINNSVTFSTVGAKLLSIRNNGTEKANFDKDGNLQMIGGGTKPTAAAGVRGTMWYSKAAAGVADTIEVCLKSAADTYSWKVIQTG